MNRGTHHSTTSARRRLLAAGWAATGVLVSAGTARLLVEVATEGVRAPGAARPDDLVLVGLAWLGVALALWLAVGSALALIALVPGAVGRLAATVADRVTPLAVRKALTLLLGASVGSLALPPAPVSSAGGSPVAARGHAGGPGALAAPDAPDAVVSAVMSPGFRPSGPSATVDRVAVAAPLGPGFRPSADPAAPAATAMTASGAHTRPAEPSPNLSPGFRPTAPVRVADGEQGRLLAPSPRPSSVSHGLVTVRRGDSLWSIARAHLGPGASDADVARAWPRWYSANREVIGGDPDLLVPGQQLVPPAPDAPAAGTSTQHLVPKE
ncbi:LysM peptidoglycan-binding domain-containing protein [Intrasporangium flavum]|uniref:LysM peptidoglycan-binding domain-containing protein n=1 Tax=Intrasporangium flavum TaxID=1428657 RepID=UPI00096EADA0|nr:LysM peptidoglycan-binding domain-containing protein [Intrasporangium flavum]